MGGRMRAAVRMVCNQDKGGIFQPDDIDPKSGQPVLAVLRSKHPEPVIPEEDSFETYDNSEECLESMQLHAYEDQVAKSAAKLSGGAGPCGLDGVSLKYMLNHFEAHSEALRVEMGLWAEWLGNTSPPYAAYRALNAGRELPADKMPGVRPILAGEIWMRLISDVIHQQVKHTATQECGNVNLCAGLSAGIEGNLHAVRAIWPQSAGWTQDDGLELGAIDGSNETSSGTPATADYEPELDAGIDREYVQHSRYQTGVGFGGGLFDADNAFGRQIRYKMLHVVAHRWNRASRFAFNLYRHWKLAYVRDKPGTTAHVLHLKEGVSQGCVFSMDLYAIGLLPLAEGMREAIPEALQPWFADDGAATGAADANAKCLKYLCEHGPAHGYYPSPSKSWYICKAEDEAIARAAFEALDLQIQYTRGHRYLGGFMGSEATKNEWLGEQLTIWTKAVEDLAVISEKYPQTAYAGFTFCLQNQWQYVQRVVADTATLFAPLEVAIRTAFILTLLGLKTADMDGELRQVLTHSVKLGGMAIRNPVDTAEHVHAASKDATAHLVASLVEEGVRFNTQTHQLTASKAGATAREERIERERAYLVTRGRGKPAVQRRDKKNKAAGLWLSVFPSRVYGTGLSANEWRDNARLRYNFAPSDIPQHCDGCGARMTVEHALSCKKGGLVSIRHDDVADEWRDLCSKATTPGHVTREPHIYSAQHRRPRVVGQTATEATQQQRDATNATTNTNQTSTQSTISEERGDAGCHGFWERGRPTIFDMRITDTEARSYRNKDYDKVLADHEKEKKRKYLQVCLEQRKNFTPMVYSVDGIAGREARHAEKHLATMLAEKWKRPYPQMVCYVRTRMTLAVVKANSLLIRGSRDTHSRRRPQVTDRAAMYDWRTHLDQ